VLGQRASVNMTRADVYASVAGGLRVTEPGIDLALALAAAGARLGRVLPDRLVVIGELGLAGEVRSVPQIDRRLAEAARLGFAAAMVPPGTAPQPGIQVIPVHELRDAVALGLIRADPGFAAVS
jgi:DNA repair protein RadA/Sms